MTEETMNRLAYRAYLYELFHIVFGAVPSAEEIDCLRSETTAETLMFYADRQSEPTRREAFSACMSAFSDIVVDDCRDTDAHCEGKTQYCVESLKSSYTRLFLVPGQDYVHPWESPYVGKEVTLFQESTLDVRGRYAAFGFRAEGFKHFPEDHIAMMLHFMGALSSRVFEAYSNHEDAKACDLMRAQSDFISVHLTYWRPKFLDDLYEKDSLGFYAVCGRALDAFLQDDFHFLECYLRTLPNAASCECLSGQCGQ